MDELVLTREQVRRVDALAVKHYGVSSLVLMENAGRGVVDVLMGMGPALGSRELKDRDVGFQSDNRGSAELGASPLPRPLPVEGRGAEEWQSRGGERTDFTRWEGASPAPFVAVLCGKGNNGGDGLVIARHLDIRGVAVRVGLLCGVEELSGDALANFELLAVSEVEFFDLSEAGAKPQAAVARVLGEHLGGAAWIVDAMLGTGATGEPREPIATAIRWMNAQPGLRLAVDVPSGLDCDTGVAAAATVRADVTCTFVGMKRGFLAEEAKPYLGKVHVVSIGLPPQLVRRVLGTYIGSG